MFLKLFYFLLKMERNRLRDFKEENIENRKINYLSLYCTKFIAVEAAALTELIMQILQYIKGYALSKEWYKKIDRLP